MLSPQLADHSAYFVLRGLFNRCASFGNQCAACTVSLAIISRMHDSILISLRAHRLQLCSRWETLLRQEPVRSPLASPDVLRHLMNWTLDEIFQTVAQTRARRRKKIRLASGQSPCPCGMNPLEIYFNCLDSALTEFVEGKFSHAGAPGFTDAELIAQDVRNALAVVRAREIEQFCSVCQHRSAPTKSGEVTAFGAPST